MATPKSQKSKFMIPPNKFPQLLTTDEVARLLRVSPATVRNMIRDGRITAIPTNGGGKRTNYRIPVTALETLMGIDQTQAQRETRSFTPTNQ
jgi:excisionase family DNA binding protein